MIYEFQFLSFKRFYEKIAQSLNIETSQTIGFETLPTVAKKEILNDFTLTEINKSKCFYMKNTYYICIKHINLKPVFLYTYLV